MILTKAGPSMTKKLPEADFLSPYPKTLKSQVLSLFGYKIEDGARRQLAGSAISLARVFDPVDHRGNFEAPFFVGFQFKMSGNIG
jgi:hypothetical protein